MEKFKSYQELLDSRNINFTTQEQAKNELDSYLACVGSEIVKSEDEEPEVGFRLDLDDEVLEIGITALEIEEYCYKTFYWIY